jgi:hypothetical protein
MFDDGEDASFPLEHINSNVMRCLRKPKQFFLVYLVIADLRVSNLHMTRTTRTPGGDGEGASFPPEHVHGNVMSSIMSCLRKPKGALFFFSAVDLLKIGQECSWD